MTRHRCFTLIELLVVVAIISIIAAIALPNFLEAQTRAKVTAAKSNLRTVTYGLEVYSVDNNTYPWTHYDYYEDPLEILARVQLKGLTTPITYVGTDSLVDPFGIVRPQPFTSTGRSTPLTSGYAANKKINADQSLVYFHYPSLSRSFNDARCYMAGAGIVSIGPDLQDSLGAYLPFPQSTFIGKFGFTMMDHPIDTVYDPTNGTVSVGDIAAFVGEAAALGSSREH